MTPTTFLEAVNSLLSALGSAPTDTLDSPNMEVILAQRILTEVSREIQTQGWAFNREIDYPLIPNQAGEILLPRNCLKVEETDGDPFLVARGKRLYDAQRQTYRLRRSVKARLVMGLPYEELPEPFRRYVLIRSARIFTDRLLGSSALHAFSEADELVALSALRNAENQATNPNLLKGNGYFDSLLRR